MPSESSEPWPMPLAMGHTGGIVNPTVATRIFGKILFIIMIVPVQMIGIIILLVVVVVTRILRLFSQYIRQAFFVTVIVVLLLFVVYNT